MGSTVTATPHHCTHLRTALTVHTSTYTSSHHLTVPPNHRILRPAPPLPPCLCLVHTHTPHTHHTDTHPKKSCLSPLCFLFSPLKSSPRTQPIPLQCSGCSLYRHLSHRTPPPPPFRHSLSHPAQPHHACCTSAWAREGVAHIDGPYRLLISNHKVREPRFSRLFDHPESGHDCVCVCLSPQARIAAPRSAVVQASCPPADRSPSTRQVSSRAKDIQEKSHKTSPHIQYSSQRTPNHPNPNPGYDMSPASFS